MAGSLLRIAFILLLLASIIQGVKNAELFFIETIEAEVGQNISMPCYMNDSTDPRIVVIKWVKKKGPKLAVYDQRHGLHLFWPNLTVQVKKNDANHLSGTYLHLPLVNKWDSGIYSCEVSIFPSDSYIGETKLTVKDEINIRCSVNQIVKVQIGDNVTIQCTVNSNVNYTWIKNNKLVSDHESLELWEVTEAHAGAYNLTVNTGEKRLHKDFIISVMGTTTTLRTDSTESTVAPSSPSHTSAATPLTTRLSTDIHWTTKPNSSTAISPAEEDANSLTTLTSDRVSSSPGTQTNHLLNSSKFNDVTVATSTQRMASDRTKNESRFNTQSAEDIFSMSTEEHRTAEIILNSGHTEGPSTESIISTVTEKETERSHTLLVFVIVLLLLLIVGVVILYRRQLIKNRMDLPPPFKPPPPPVKYTAARRSETQLYPTSRCNSLCLKDEC